MTTLRFDGRVAATTGAGGGRLGSCHADLPAFRGAAVVGNGGAAEDTGTAVRTARVVTEFTGGLVSCDEPLTAEAIRDNWARFGEAVRLQAYE